MTERTTAKPDESKAPKASRPKGKPKGYVVADGKSINCTRKGALNEGAEVTAEIVGGQSVLDSLIEAGAVVSK